MKNKIRATIVLYSGNKKRQTPFKSGYRPLFTFAGMPYMVSGSITLFDRDQMAPGESAEVEVRFFDHESLSLILQEDMEFTFSEGLEILGAGKILQVLSGS